MRMLLDTHVWLWMIGDPERLSSTIRDALVADDNDVYLSAASIWEILIKVGTGKVRYIGKPEVMIPTHIRRSGVIPLSISIDHALRVSSLPDHHRDPFDRILIAQAQADDLTLVTADDRLSGYDVTVVGASG